jgi:hypothetical protein
LLLLSLSVCPIMIFNSVAVCCEIIREGTMVLQQSHNDTVVGSY